MTPWPATRTLSLVGALGLALFLGACAPARRRPPEVPERHARQVRVGLATRVPSVALGTRGRWEVRSNGDRLEVPPATTLRAERRDGRVFLATPEGAWIADAEALRIEPQDRDATLLLADVPYRGRFELRQDAGLLALVEELDIEEYLRGVVPWEIGRGGSDVLAAVEAQTIAARTYTCSRLGSYADQGFDVFPDERDQVYRGELRRDPVADRAIAATRGLVLECDGQLVQAYYSSTCGGHTSWIEHVWSKPAAAYLRGRRDAPAGGGSFCSGSPHFRWTEAWSGADLERTLQSTLPGVLKLPADRPVGGLLALAVVERDLSARVLDLEVQTTTETFHVRGDSIRWALRPRDRALLRSLMFELEIERVQGSIVRVVARGGGNGHGVGMCQSGALGMARAGYDAAAILSHYYPGTNLHRAY